MLCAISVSDNACSAHAVGALESSSIGDRIWENPLWDQCIFNSSDQKLSKYFVISISKKPSSNSYCRLVMSYKGEISLHFDLPVAVYGACC